MDYQQAAKRISTVSGVSMRPASTEALRALAELGAPESLIAFYREFEPEADVEIGTVRLPTISSMIVENTDAVPGADLGPHRFTTFATTIYGDAYCFDWNAAEEKHDAPVVIMTHEVLFDDLDRETVLRARKRVASGFGHFLAQFVDLSLDTEPHYPQRP